MNVPLEPPTPASRRIVMIWYAAAALAVWSFGYTKMMGSDLWWHLAGGRYIVEQRQVLHLTDPWSYTFFGQPWLHHEWLGDVVYHAWTSAFGMEALVWWKWGVMVAAYLLLMDTLRRIGAGSGAAWLATVMAVAVGAPFLDVRPHLYTLLGFATICRMTVGSERPSAWLPLVFLVWANVHGGFFFGLPALGLLLLPFVLRGGWRRASILFVACALVSLLNPHGVGAFAYPLKYAFDATSPFRSLGEWRPPFRAGGIQAPLFPIALVLFPMMLAAVFAIPRLRQERRVSLAGVLLGVLTLAMALRSRRFIPLFAMTEALIAAPVLTQVGQRFLRSRRFDSVIALAALIVSGLLLVAHPVSSAAFGDLTASDLFPRRTVDYAERQQLRGKVFAYYNWGGYLHLRTDGALRVYIDGRADTVYDAATYRDYVKVLKGEPGWQGIIERSGAEYILWPADEKGTSTFETMIRSGRWRVLYNDDVAQLLQSSSARSNE